MSNYEHGSLGWWIDECRGAMTWDQLAERAGVSAETLYRATGGRSRTPQPDKMKTATRQGVERALGWGPGSIEAILDGGEPTSTAPRGLHVVEGEPEVDTRGVATDLYSLYLESPAKFHARRMEVSRDYPEQVVEEIQRLFREAIDYGWPALEKRDA